MITVTVSHKSFQMLRNSLENAKLLERDIELSVKKLEETPRHRVSPESLELAQETERLKCIRTVIAELELVVREGESDFLTSEQIDHRISASQPYNTGSRENY